ncbi:MAG: bifunctional DNA-formamidopyrimidine glycosylase/DNA-(apurinic or apyrimidinic site) lyase [Patescibacteria group bacterium]
MPELPEVQTTASGINTHLKGLIIKDVWTNYDSAFYSKKEEIKNPKYFSFFKKTIVGAKITGSTRRAKNVLIHLSNGQTILTHMKMTGHYLHGTYIYDPKGNLGKYRQGTVSDPWVPAKDGPLADPFNRFIRLIFVLSDGTHLALSDMRRFAKTTVIKTSDLDTSHHLIGIGPEPLEDAFTFKAFKERLHRRPAGKIKQVIMDQAIMAGVGNIYADESLWRASIHPLSIIKKIPEPNLKNLYNAIRKTLLKGIDFGGDSMSDYRNIHGERGEFQEQHQAYRKTGKPCRKPGCKGMITRIVLGGRGTHFCSVHQVKF